MSCVILNKSKLSSKEVVEKLFNSGEIIEEKDEKFIWNIENRYYTAKVCLYIIKDLVNVNINNVGGLIYYVDSCETEDILADLARWKKCVEDGNNEEDGPEVQLIVVEKFLNDDLKNKVLSWSLDNGAELVDMFEDFNEDFEGVNCFATSATKRISEALQTCPWSNFQHEKDEILENTEGKDDVDDFESLFSQLVNFRDSAGGLRDTDRKAFAEKIALAFYSSINSDEEDL